MPDLTPTPEDLERDLVADYALCEAATGGPWDALDSRVETWWFRSPNGGVVLPGCVEWQILGGQAPGLSTDYGWAVLHGKADKGTIHPKREDLLLIAAARTGWPAALRCCLAARAERDKLQAFKDWTHGFLDTQGVPHHPPGSHGAAGCRIGDRMDWLMERLRTTESERDEARSVLKRCWDAAGLLDERMTGQPWQHYDPQTDLIPQVEDLASLAQSRDEAEADVERLRQIVRDLLLSADAAWEEHALGHDWPEAVAAARAELSKESPL